MKLVIMHTQEKLAINTISMGQSKEDVTPMRSQWSYVFFSVTHRFAIGRHNETKSSRFAPSAAEKRHFRDKRLLHITNNHSM